MKTGIGVVLIVVCAWPAFGQPRIVRGQIFDRRSPDWTIFSDPAEVIGTSGRNLIVRTFTERNVEGVQGGTGNMRAWPTYRHEKIYHETFVVTNFPAAGRYKTGDVIQPPIIAMRVGSAMLDSGERSVYTSSSGYHSTYSSSAFQHDLYDCGAEYVPPARELTPEEAAAAKAAVEKRSEAAALATFKFHLEKATEGSAASQLRLGQLYLQGKGTACDTNQARVWFQRAADQGNEEAATELRQLNQTMANSR
jgi:hypothetical protein